MSVLVLGIGNILLKDEGIGVHVVDALEQRYDLPADIEVVDGGTAGMELLQYITKHEQLIIVDAMKTGAAPGTLVKLNDDEVPAFFQTKISPHQLGLSDMLASMILTGETPPVITLIGIIPVDLGTGLELSDEIAAKLDDMLAMVIEELERLDYSPVPKLDVVAS